MINFYIAAFLADLALGAVLLSLPLLLIYKFGASSLTLGLFGALGSFVYCIGVITAGRLSDRFNKKKIIIYGCILFILVYLILPNLPLMRHVFFIYVFGAISMSMFWPTIQSWISQGLNKAKLVRALSNFNICWSVGLMFGFLSAGVLFSINRRAPFIWGIFFIAVVIFILLKQPITSETHDESARKIFLETEKDRPESATKFLYISWCANFVSWFIMGIMRNLFPKLGTELGFSTAAIGFFVFLFILAQTIMFFIFGRTHKWYYALLPILFFQVLAITGLSILTVFSTSAHFIVAMLLLGLSGGMTYASSLFYSLYGFIDKGKRSGIHEAFIATGAFFGPFIGGITASKFHIRAPYIAAALLLAVAITIEIIIYRNKK